MMSEPSSARSMPDRMSSDSRSVADNYKPAPRVEVSKSSPNIITVEESMVVAQPDAETQELLLKLTNHCKNAAVAEVRKASALNVCRRKVLEYDKTLPQHAKFPQIAIAQTAAKAKAEQDFEIAKKSESETTSIGEGIFKELASRIGNSSKTTSWADIAEQKELLARVGDIAERLSGQEKKSDALSRDYAALKQENETLKELNNELERKHANIEESVKKLTADNIAWQSNIGHVTKSNQDIKAEVGTMKNTYSKVTEALDDLRKNVDQAREEVKSRNTSIDALSGLSGQHATLLAKFDILEHTSFKDVQSRISKLEMEFPKVNAMPPQKALDVSTILKTSDSRVLSDRLDVVDTRLADLDAGQKAMDEVVGGQLDAFEKRLVDFSKSRPINTPTAPGQEVLALGPQTLKKEVIEVIRADIESIKFAVDRDIESLKKEVNDTKRNSVAVANALVDKRMQALSSEIHDQFQQRIDMEHSLNLGTIHLTKRFDALMTQDMAHYVLAQLGQAYPDLKDANAAIADMKQTVHNHTGSIDEYGHIIENFRTRLDALEMKREQGPEEVSSSTGGAAKVLAGPAREELDGLTHDLGKISNEVKNFKEQEIKALKSLVEKTRTDCEKGISGFADHLVKNENSFKDLDNVKIPEIRDDVNKINESLEGLERDVKAISVEQLKTDIRLVRIRLSSLETNGPRRADSNGARRPESTRSFDREPSRQPVMHDEEATAQLLNASLSNRRRPTSNGHENGNGKTSMSPFKASRNGSISIRGQALKRNNSGSTQGSPKKKRKRAFGNLDLSPQDANDDSGDEDFRPS